ncbi:MAG: HAD-IA family hydrolase [Pseudomonadota bacterium]
MRAVFFGSIGTIVETSELQRAAFNEAFLLHGLRWHWERGTYQSLLGQAGGAARIARYATQKDERVDHISIHATKSRLFHRALRARRLDLRPGVMDVCAWAKSRGMALALVTTTDRAIVAALLEASFGADDVPFDLISAADPSLKPKPSPDTYRKALADVDLDPGTVLAIEDNADGLKAARAAGLTTVAFPGANTFATTVNRKGSPISSGEPRVSSERIDADALATTDLLVTLSALLAFAPSRAPLANQLSV